MSLSSESAEPLWRYTAVDQSGRQVKDVVRASDMRSAARVLAGQGLTPLQIRQDVVVTRGAAGSRNRGFKFSERVLVLRQLALMIEAGVGLLEALRTVMEGIEAERGRAQLAAVVASLTRGETFAAALEAHAPGFPFYVYAMTRVGESTGRIGEVMRDAAEQMAYEDRLRRDFVNALTYPAFLLCAGTCAVLFIFTQVVPRFARMIGDKRDNMPFASRMVLEIGLWANSHLVLVFAGMAGLIVGVVVAVSTPAVRKAAYNVGLHVPMIGQMLRSREILSWARLLSFSLANGVILLEAAALARRAAPDGPFQRGLVEVERELRGGMSLDGALARHSKLTGMDLSLLRAGAKSGTLPRMFGFLADGYDNRLRDLMKRITALIEPLAIGGIAILVGAVALSLVLALTSVYESIS